MCEYEWVAQRDIRNGQVDLGCDRGQKGVI